jgi:hypothetical protein
VTHVLPWYVVDLGLPVGAAALLTVVRIDGRPAHLAAQSLVRYRLCPRQSIGLRPIRAGFGAEAGAHWWPQEVLLLPDGSDAHMRRLRYTGPGAVLVRIAYERVEPARYTRYGMGRPTLRVRESPHRRLLDPGQVIALAPDARLRTS